MASQKDADGHITTYSYDAKGNLTKVTPPAPMRATTMTYDQLSRLKTGFRTVVFSVRKSYFQLVATSKLYDQDGFISRLALYSLLAVISLRIPWALRNSWEAYMR
jgi:hypothetical protein